MSAPGIWDESVACCCTGRSQYHDCQGDECCSVLLVIATCSFAAMLMTAVVAVMLCVFLLLSVVLSILFVAR